jgi:hypothetical protein
MSACENRFLTKECGCLPHPIKDQGTMCGYVDREYGYIVPCNASCCSSKCTDDDLIPGIQVQTSTGTGNPPPGFGTEIQTSNEPTETKGASDFSPVQVGDYKVWEIMIIPMLLLLLVLLVA